MCERILRVRARDITDSTAPRSALVLAPHPDDETIGCGATIARKRSAGARVTVCIATDGRGSVRADAIGAAATVKQRSREVSTAAAALGLLDDELRFLGHEDGTLESSVGSLIAQLAALIDETLPDDVFLPCAVDAHPDHRALSAAAQFAVTRSRSAPGMLAYPVWFTAPGAWTRRGGSRGANVARLYVGPWVAALRLRPRVVEIGPYRECKQHALEQYADELATLPPDFAARFLGDHELFLALR